MVMKTLSFWLGLCLVLMSSAAICAQSMSVNVEFIGRGITGLTVNPISPGLSCVPGAGFAACLSVPVPSGSAANTPIATLAPITVPKGQPIASITMSGADAGKFALSGSCNPYAAPCTMMIGTAPLAVISPVDASGNPIPYAITLTITAP